MADPGYSNNYGQKEGQVPPPQPTYYAMGAQPPSYNTAQNYSSGYYPPPSQSQNQVAPNQNQAYYPAGQGMAQGGVVNYGNSAETGYAPPATVYSQGGSVMADEAAPKPYEDGDAGSTFGSSFSDKAVRRAFIRKVYLILTSQLLFTFGMIAVFIFVKPVKEWAQTSTGLYFYIAAFVLFLVLYITLVCVRNVRRKSPGNFICLGAFTICFSYMAAMISSFHDTNIVLIAMGITALVCFSISLFAIQTKIDFTMCSGFLFVFSMVVFFFGWSCVIFYSTSRGSMIMNSVYGALVALLFGLFLIYDTQMVVGGGKYELSPEEYVFGALQLYVDVVQLFLIILSFFGGNSN